MHEHVVIAYRKVIRGEKENTSGEHTVHPPAPAHHLSTVLLQLAHFVKHNLDEHWQGLESELVAVRWMPW